MRRRSSVVSPTYECWLLPAAPVEPRPYAVVQFVQLPYADVGDCVCVPRSWVRGFGPTDSKSMVAYPMEPPSITKMRIMNGDEPSGNWNLYLAIVKVVTHSYEDAYEYVVEKNHNASRNRYSAAIRTDYKRVPATATERYRPSMKTINLFNSQSQKNRSKMKVVDKVRLSDMISNPSKYPEYSNAESRTLASSEPRSFFSSKNTVIKENCKQEHQDQASRDLLLRYPYIQRKSEKEPQVSSPAAGSRSTGKTRYASKYPSTVANQICDYALKPEENQLLSIHREHLHQIALTQEIPDNRIPNRRTFTLDLSEPVIQDNNIGSHTSFAIQNPTNEDNQFSQLDPESSPVIQEHRQVLPKQKTPGQSSEVECATSEPTAHSKMTSASHTSIASSNLAEHQDAIVEDIVVDELTEASCIEQNVFSGTRAENESSANPKDLEEANHSGQTIESSMKKGSPMVEAVASSGISSMQDVDNDEQSKSSELNSDEITNTSPNSNEQANQPIISVLKQTDVWADQVYDLFQNMQINFSESCHIAREMYESLLESKRVIECIAKTSENLRAKKKCKVAVVTSKEVSTEVQQTAEENQDEIKKQENPVVSIEEDKKEGKDVDFKSDDDVDSEHGDDCGGDIEDGKDQDSNNEIPKTTRGHIRTFVLPPEYDAHDTRWTLKYRKNNPKLNLVELVPGSRVFIAGGGRALARELLEEVFARSARASARRHVAANACVRAGGGPARAARECKDGHINVRGKANFEKKVGHV